MMKRGLLALIMVALVSAALSVSAALTVGAAPAGEPLRQATPAQPVSCAVRVARLQIRSGPGTAFPVIGQLSANRIVRAVAFVPRGAPGGRWVRIEATPATTLAFISAENQFIVCRSSLLALPSAPIPPTPRAAPTRTPQPTPTRVQLVGLVPVFGDLSAAPNIRGSNPRNDGALVSVFGITQQQAERMLEEEGNVRFDDALAFAVDVFDDTVGTKLGDGIREVVFDVYYFDNNGQKVQVHLQRERNKPYCVFGDQGGACTVWRFSQHGNRWPNGEPLTSDTLFSADITIRTTRGQEAVWLWNFRMD